MPAEGRGIERIPAKHILIRAKSTQWFGTDYTMNLYRGCCHGCIYCDSRSDCYRIEEFHRVRAKAGALELLRDDLRRKIRPGVVGAGAMSDPYNPFEREEMLTANALALLDAYQFGVAVATKSDLITRDIPLYQMIQSHSPVLCKLTITTVDDALAAKVEPGAPSPSRRLAAVEQLAKAGLPVCVLLMPVLPFLEDQTKQVLDVVEAAARAGARYVYPAFGMTLRDSQRAWYYAKLEEAFPGMGLPEQYRRQYGERYWCLTPRVRELWPVFRRRCRELGLLYEMKAITSSYQRGYGDRQLTFFP